MGNVDRTNKGVLMSTVGFALLFGFGGFFVAAIYTFIIGLAGAPGAFLSAVAAKRSPDGVTPVWGLLLTVAGQVYVSLVFVVLVIHFAEAALSEATGFSKWFAWGVAFFVAIAPITFALKDATHAERQNVQHIATTLTAPLTVIGFFLFKFFPTIMNAGWGWVPKL